MQTSIILSDEMKEKFCMELNIDSSVSKILITINGNYAEYYNFDDDCYYQLDIDIALKYI